MTYMEIFSYTFDLTSKRGKSGVKERFPFWGLVTVLPSGPKGLWTNSKSRALLPLLSVLDFIRPLRLLLPKRRCSGKCSNLHTAWSKWSLNY